MRCKHRVPRYKFFAASGMIAKDGTKACGIKTFKTSSYCEEHYKRHQPVQLIATDEASTNMLHALGFEEVK